MEFLWTDKSFLTVLIIACVGILYSMRRLPARMALQRIMRRPLAVSAGVVLLFFLTIAVLDSIHIHFTALDRNEGVSQQKTGTVLDWLLYPLGDFYEKTYSAPLALKLYTSEMRVIDGKVEQIYPLLKYPSFASKTAVIANEVKQSRTGFCSKLDLDCFANARNDDFKMAKVQSQARRTFIYQSIVLSFIYTLLMGLILYTLGAVWHRYKRGQWFFKRSTSAKAVGFIFIVMVFIVCILYLLSRQLHVFGTGKIGQDILYYAVKSIRTGLVIGLLTTLIMLPLALLLGIAAGYFGGIVDDGIQYLYTTLSSIPGILLITASILSMQTFIANHPEYFPTLADSADARLFALCAILGVTSWTSLCRLLRAEVLKLREVDYVQAAVALGTRPFMIIFRHLLPNVMHIVVITLVLDFSFLVLAEAVLSYVGVGVSPMTISWGNMINGARLELAREPLVWWPMMTAFLFMFLLVLCGNLFADAVRDAFDPHHASL